MTAAATGVSLCFTIPQIVVWRRNHLHPLGVLIMSALALALWFSILVLAGIGIGVRQSEVQTRSLDKWEGIMLFDAVVTHGLLPLDRSTRVC